MAETQRDLTTLLANLLDNTSGLISPEDVRDAIVSLAGGFGGMEGQGSVAAVGTTPLLIAWWGTLLPDDADNAVIGNLGTETIDVTVGGIYEVHFNVLFSGTASKFFTVEIFVNGVASGVKVNANTDSGGVGGNLTLSGPVVVAAGQSIDVRVNEASTAGNTFSGDARSQFWAKRLN